MKRPEAGVASVRAIRGVDSEVRFGMAALVADLANERRTWVVEGMFEDVVVFVDDPFGRWSSYRLAMV